MLVDLHNHTHCSDGALSPTELAARQKARGVSLWALTDHDTCQGSAVAEQNFDAHFIRASELSVVETGHPLHLLCYDAGNSLDAWQQVAQRLLQIQADRRTRIAQIAENLKPRGVMLDVDAVLARAQHGSVGRPHIAAELVAQGVVRNNKEAFDKYLYDGGPGHVPLTSFSLGEALDLVTAAGGVAAIAHPHLYGYDLVKDWLTRYRGQLSGLEVFYGEYGNKERTQWAKLAHEMNVVATAGSDFHGWKQDSVQEVGVEVEVTIAERLFAWLGRPIPN